MLLKTNLLAFLLQHPAALAGVLKTVVDKAAIEKEEESITDEKKPLVEILSLRCIKNDRRVDCLPQSGE
jgi:hypothetical protein